MTQFCCTPADAWPPTPRFSQRFLLPGNSSRYAKDLLLAVRVLPTSPLVKKKLKESGLRNQAGFSLTAIWRNDKLSRLVGR